MHKITTAFRVIIEPLCSTAPAHEDPLRTHERAVIVCEVKTCTIEGSVAPVAFTVAIVAVTVDSQLGVQAPVRMPLQTIYKQLSDFKYTRWSSHLLNWRDFDRSLQVRLFLTHADLSCGKVKRGLQRCSFTDIEISHSIYLHNRCKNAISRFGWLPLLRFPNCDAILTGW